MPFTSGRRGEPFSVASWRLYSPTFSDYFPRSDAQIERDLAGRFMMNIREMFACIERKLRRKADEVARSQRFYGFFGGVTGMLLTPMIASANLVTWVTEFASAVNTDYNVEVPVTDLFEGFISFAAILGGEPGAVGKFGSALLNLYEFAIPEGEVDPRVRQVLLSGVPELVGAAIRDFGIGTAGGNAIGTGVLGALGVQNLATDVLTIAVRQLADAIRGVGVRRVEDFYTTVLDLQNLPAKMIPFILWAMRTLALDEVMEAAAQQAGVETSGDVSEPLRQEIREQGETVPIIVERPETVTARNAVKAGAGLGLGAASLFLPFVFTG